MRQKILIVDDNPQNLTLLQDTLEPVGYDLYFMTDSKKVLQKITDINPDLILLDIMMPDIDGFEVCKRLKNDSKTAGIPIIFLSALSDQQTKIKAFDSGGVDYICKPFSCHEVAKRVETHLQKSKMINSLELLLKKTGHEFYTPLSVIDTSLKLHEMEFGESEYISACKAASKTIHGIYTDLLYTIRSHSFEFDSVQINICEFVQERIAYFKVVSGVKGMEILQECDCCEENNHFLFMNPTELERVVDNTISNAIKYGFQGSVIKVGIIRKQNDTLCLKISNKGHPIKDVQKIFEKFYRESTIEYGMGLGLDIVFHICKKYDIQMEASSENGENSFVYKFKPLADLWSQK